MIMVADFPCLWLAPENLPGPAPLRVRNVFPHACRVDPRDRPGQLAALERMAAESVLLLAPDVLPGRALRTMRPDQLLLEHDLPVGWLVRNAVTGELASAPGATLWPRGRLLTVLRDRAGLPPSARAVVPLVGGDWAFNRDPAASFTAAFVSVRERHATAADDPAASAALAVHASLGADAPHGAWWTIGACHALLGHRPAAEALAIERNALADRDAAARRARDLVREARRATGVPLRPLTADESRLYKALRFDVPPRSAYLAMAAIYDGLGQIGAAAAHRHRQAAAWAWGEPSPPAAQATGRRAAC